MAWSCNDKCDERRYANPEESAVFRIGYTDGYDGYTQWEHSPPEYFPNAYSAGYWEGRGDR